MDSNRKIFVGGISREADENVVRTALEAIGPVTEVKLSYRTGSASHAHCGHVVFAAEEHADRVIKSGTINIGGRDVEVRKWGDLRPNARLTEVHKRKIFVGGFGPEKTEDDIRNFFKLMGEVDTVDVIRQRDKNSTWAFITFHDQTSADNIVQGTYVPPGGTAEGNSKGGTTYRVGREKYDVRRFEPNASNRNRPPLTRAAAIRPHGPPFNMMYHHQPPMPSQCYGHAWMLPQMSAQMPAESLAAAQSAYGAYSPAAQTMQSVQYTVPPQQQMYDMQPNAYQSAVQQTQYAAQQYAAKPSYATQVPPTYMTQPTAGTRAQPY